MRVKQAKDLARQWVTEEASRTPGFYGAFYHGSTNWLPDDAILPATSDLDIIVALAEPLPPTKLGKLAYRDVLLDVSYMSHAELQSPELILSQSHLAGSFRTPGIIVDPTGRLAQLQATVARDYAKRRWVRKRCEHARDKVLGHLEGVREGRPFHDQAMSWIFGAGVTTHMLLVAGLKNPTVRRRYVAVRELLADYERMDLYATLLDMLGCAQMSAARVEQHLIAMAEAFDAAKAVIKTPFPFASDISDIARPAALDGSRALIERGLHREAIFWIVVTYSRCQSVLDQDAPAEMQARFDPGYRRLLADLGITSFADLAQRTDQVKNELPSIMQAAESILAANPEIEDEPHADLQDQT